MNRATHQDLRTTLSSHIFFDVFPSLKRFFLVSLKTLIEIFQMASLRLLVPVNKRRPECCSMGFATTSAVLGVIAVQCRQFNNLSLSLTTRKYLVIFKYH